MATRHAYRCSGEHEDGFCIPLAPNEVRGRPLPSALPPPRPPAPPAPQQLTPRMPAEARRALALRLGTDGAAQWWRSRLNWFDGRRPHEVFTDDPVEFWAGLDAYLEALDDGDLD